MKSMAKALCGLIGALMLPMMALGNGAMEEEFDQAGRLYRNNDFAGAIAVYEQIIKSGYSSWELHYNLGNAYFKNGRLGLAILHYEKAIKSMPRDSDLKSNLEMARLRVADQVEAPRLLVWELLDRARDFYAMNTLACISLTVYLLFIALIAVYFFLPRGKWKKAAFAAAAPVFILFILLFTTFLWRIWLDKNVQQGIIIAEKVDVLSAPDESGQILFSLHEGVKANMEQHLNPYVEIRLPDGKKGWIPQETIAEI